MINMIKNFVKDESGATAIEYGLIAALVAVAIIGALTILGTELANIFQFVADTLAGVSGGGAP
ncbi:MAG TPA: Flp family type IVb pilin [Dongiaceae bacterium]|jgi:pilus assembly protein Flp/PilA